MLQRTRIFIWIVGRLSEESLRFLINFTLCQNPEGIIDRNGEFIKKYAKDLEVLARLLQMKNKQQLAPDSRSGMSSPEVPPIPPAFHN